MNTSPTQQHTYDDEIDLIELVQDLWQEKWLIVAIGFVTTLLALIYALVATPVYQATAYIQEPSLHQIQSYNAGRTALSQADTSTSNRNAKNIFLQEFTTDDIYKGFLRELKSKTLAREFLEKVYLPTQKNEPKQLTEQQLQNRLEKLISIKQSDPKTNPNNYEVSFNSSNPEEAANFANTFLNFAIKQTKANLKLNIETELKVGAKSLEIQINGLRNNAKNSRLDEIARLEEALQIAKDIGLVNPSLPSGKTTEEGANYVDRNLTYMRGSKALEAQLKALKNRTNDDPFIEELRELQIQRNLLKAISFNDKDAEVVKIDQLAVAPENRIKPKRKLILAVGLVAGGMLGVFAALVRSMLRKRAKQLAQQSA